MMNGMTKLIIFAAGAVIGSAVTWKLVKDKYERIANEEIKSVKERYSKKTAKDSDTDELDDVSLADTIKEVEEYLNKIDESGYSTEIKEKGGAKSMKNDRPYIIAPEEFDDQPDYDAVSLTYYEDGVVTDMWDEKIDDDEVEDLVGRDALTHFGEYEEDSVFIRNDNLKTDYEILRDYRRYSDVVPDNSPDQVDE